MISVDTKEGQQFSGKIKEITSWRTYLFSGGWPHGQDWPAKNIHTDLEVARNSGLSFRIASGSMLVGYTAELMIDLFGENWLRYGKIDIKFVRGARINDTIITTAVVRYKRPQATSPSFRYLLDFWCENQHKDKLAVGTATCLLE